MSSSVILEDLMQAEEKILLSLEVAAQTCQVLERGVSATIPQDIQALMEKYCDLLEGAYDKIIEHSKLMEDDDSAKLYSGFSVQSIDATKKLVDGVIASIDSPASSSR